MRTLVFLGALAVLAGCGPKQSDACAKMFECDSAYVEAVEGYDGTWFDDDLTYGKDGSCWTGNAAAADACDSSCETVNTANKNALQNQVDNGTLESVPAACE